VFALRPLKTQGEYPGIPENMNLLDSTRYAMNYIATSNLEKLYTFTVTDEVLSELERISSRYIEDSIDRPLKSLEMLNMI
jgi:DNA repair protein RecO (recombination protein O)